MFVLITGEYEVIGCDTKIDVFATKSEAYDAMVNDAKKRALDAGVAEDEFAMYVDNLGDDGGRIDEVVGWQIREIPDSPSPKRNPNVAVSCECSGRIGSRVGDTPYKYEEL